MNAITSGLEPRYLTVPCPTCTAAPGVACTVRRGPPGRTTHLARQDSAVLAMRRDDDRGTCVACPGSRDGCEARRRARYGRCCSSCTHDPGDDPATPEAPR